MGAKTRSAGYQVVRLVKITNQFPGREGDYVAYVDKVLKCRDCGSDFVFASGEQEFYVEKGFQHEPTRCRDCRTNKKRTPNGPANRGGRARELYDATCAECGVATQVPFQPRGDRPVLCRDCFSSARA